MSMKEATIQINDLSIGYHSKNDTKLVASHITTTIYSGELTCLLGANGVGKSTLLRTLSAFQPRISGEIALLSRDIQDYSDKELSTIVGVVLTDKCEIRNMTVRELSVHRFLGTVGKRRQADRRRIYLPGPYREPCFAHGAHPF